jgi:hypothetical protein
MPDGARASEVMRIALTSAQCAPAPILITAHCVLCYSDARRTGLGAIRGRAPIARCRYLARSNKVAQ